MANTKPLKILTLRVSFIQYLNLMDNDLSNINQLYINDLEDSFYFKCLLNPDEVLVVDSYGKHSIVNPEDISINIKVVSYEYLKQHAIFKEEKSLFDNI